MKIRFIIILMFFPVAISYAKDVDFFITFEKNIQIGEKHYNYSLSGIREYMNILKQEDIELYKTLVPDLEQMENYNIIGWSTIISSSVIGFGMFVGGYTIFANEEEKEEINGIRQSERKPNYNIAFSGLGLATLGIITGLYLLPGKMSIKGFIEKHNSASSEKKIKINIGYYPGPNGYTFAGVAFRY